MGIVSCTSNVPQNDVGTHLGLSVCVYTYYTHTGPDLYMCIYIYVYMYRVLSCFAVASASCHVLLSAPS